MSQEKIIFHKNPAFDKCPNCGEIASLRRSHARTTFEKLLKFTGYIKIYRCRQCGWRGNRSTFTFKITSVKTLLIYALLILLTAAVVKIVIGRVAN